MKRIIAVFALLMLAFAAVSFDTGAEEAAQKDPATEFKSITYDVSAFTAGQNESIFELPKMGLGIEDEKYELVADQILHVEDVIDIIFNEVGADKWPPDSSAYIAPANKGEVIVRNTEQVHAEVRRVMEMLRPSRVWYDIEGAALKVPVQQVLQLADTPYPSVKAASEASLAAQGESLLYFSSRIKTNRTSVFSKIERKTYCKEFMARVAAMSRGYELITDTVTYGVSIVTKIVETEGEPSLHVSFDSCELLDLVPLETPAGTLEKPWLRRYETRPADVGMPLETCVAVPFAFGEDSYVLFIKLTAK
ncbi:MAG: hypothetical protein U5N86_01440 [Planctomycetota bacterium]|nr:hypothetical protein [Planctomycetota bacterium]